jgi:hypothetical protein
VILARGSAVAGPDAAGAERDVALPVRLADTAATQDTADRGAVTAMPSANDDAMSVHEQLAALPDVERHDTLVGLVRQAVVGVLRLDASRPPQREQRLMDFGVDSMMAVEFRNVLTRQLKLPKKLPATLMFDYPTVDAIATYLDRLLFGAASGGRTAPESKEERAAPAAAAELEQLDEAAVEMLLNQRLKGI